MAHVAGQERHMWVVRNGTFDWSGTVHVTGQERHTWLVRNGTRGWSGTAHVAGHERHMWLVRNGTRGWSGTAHEDFSIFLKMAVQVLQQALYCAALKQYERFKVPAAIFVYKATWH
jgi:hypothetical protein